MTKIVAIVNQKGGVGKTTTAWNLGVVLTQQGYRVLLIDLDAQGGLTALMGLDPYQMARSSYSLLMFDEVSLARTMQMFGSGLALVPGSIDLATAAVKITQEEQPLDRLHRVLATSRIKFDYVFIDTPPTLDVITAISLIAANGVIIPTQTHYLALLGIRNILDTMNRIQQFRNPDLRLLGALATMYDPQSAHAQSVLTEMQAVLPGRVFQTIIPYDPHVIDSPHSGKALVEYAPTSPAALAYRSLADELGSLTVHNE